MFLRHKPFIRFVQVYGILKEILYPDLYPDPSTFIRKNIDGDFKELRNFRGGRQVSHPEPQVQLDELGSVLGYFLQVSNGRYISAFEGIPYAEAPVNDLRFRRPVPKKPWHSVLKATSKPNLCIQTRIINPGTFGDEDCLYLNIYSPTISQSQKNNLLPVILFIHGGGNHVGGSSHYGPSYLLIQDVVLVTVNYRLGLFGFLSTGSCSAPGNWGHHDQSLAIHFVRQHIHKFSGDSEKVTIMGQSSGAVGAHLQLLSPLSRANVKQAILMSGSAFAFWAVARSPNPKRSNARALAAHTFCNFKRESQMLRCLRSRPARGLELASNLILVRRGVAFQTVVEPFCPGENFIHKTPYQYYEEGEVAKVPVIVSMTSKELELNLVLETAGIRTEGHDYQHIFPFLDSAMPDLLGYRENTDDPNAVTQKILSYYYDDEDDRDLRIISNIATDRTFSMGIRLLINYHSQLSETYGILFNHTNGIGFANKLHLPPHRFAAVSMLIPKGPLGNCNVGVPHGEDILFLFNRTDFPSIPASFDNVDFRVVNLLQTLYVNFAKYGYPYYSGLLPYPHYLWKPINYNYKEIEFLEVTKPGGARMTLMTEFQRATDFWLSLKIMDL